MPKAGKRPVASHVPKIKTPVAGAVARPTNWVFSFAYFEQVEYFGLDGTEASWFVSLLERLKDLCKQDRERFFRDYSQKDGYRYHAIEWGAKNIPISRKDFTWLPRDIVENEDEFPFFQFHISKALGRVVGFWTENDTIFNIVLLDPLHNIQPSVYHDYKVRACDPLGSEYSSLLLDIERLSSKICNDTSCTILQSLKQCPTKLHDSNFFYFSMSDGDSKFLKRILEKKTLIEILEMGLLRSEE